MSAGNRKNLLWLQSGGCSGCTMSLICEDTAGFIAAFDLAGIDILWHPSLSLESGRDVRDIFDDIRNQRTRLDILCLEGSVIRGPDGSGKYHVAAGTGGMPMMELIEEMSQLAETVVGVGSCAAYGGVTAAGDNLVDACGLAFDGEQPGGLLGARFKSRNDMPVVNIPGCPVHPAWVCETLQQIGENSLDQGQLDKYGRPVAISGSLVHHGCSRNEYYEYKASAEKLCHMGCMMEHLGCKGTQAIGDCNKRPWNGSGSCISGGYPCIACTEPGFEEPGHPFVETPKIAGIPIGLPSDMPKAWFVALASLSKAATPGRLRRNAVADRIVHRPKTSWRDNRK